MELIVATNNMGKLKEFSRILSPLGFSVLSMGQAGVAVSPEETGATFAENAAIKARAVYERTGKACLADDSGLSVHALGGAPGVYSARYAGEHADAEANNRKLLRELGDSTDRAAEFVTALHLIFENGETLSVCGRCKGEIGFAPRGENGFGYDPLFFVDGKSYAERTDAQKDAISHRGNALRELVHCLEMRKKQC